MNCRSLLVLNEGGKPSGRESVDVEVHFLFDVCVLLIGEPVGTIANDLDFGILRFDFLGATSVEGHPDPALAIVVDCKIG